ncbi:MAG: CsgG/HfaB family protein [Desulfobacterales bacterium]|nr:CsgG/HfaB family protein [Desulfobacterales bacterium]
MKLACKKRHFIPCLAAVALLAMVAGCQTAPKQGPVEKDGRLYGVTEGSFRHNWWNYYERALSYADGGFWAEAERDLLDAIKRRRDDQWRARTYGMHFVDYFPHRELGIVFYSRKRIEAAIKELEISLATEISAKAQLYLDRARKALIEKDQLDRLPPEIVIRSPQPNFLTNTFTVNIQGTARDDTYVRYIQVGGRDYRIDVSSREISFDMQVPVLTGTNHIPVVATDLSGKQTRTVVTVNVDRTGPVITIDTPAEGDPIAAGQVYLSGYALDDSGLDELIINGQPFPGDGTRKMRIEKTVSLQPGETRLAVAVKDKAGNTTSAVIALSEAARRDISGDGTAPADRTPPVIRLRDLKNEQVTYLDQAFIEGSIKDSGGVSRLLINQEQVLKDAGNNVYFSRLVGLEPGENLITVRGLDRAGNAAAVSVRIRREILKVRQTGSRLRVAVNQFNRKTIGRDRQLSHGFEDILSADMLKRARFSLIDRRDLQTILKEIAMGQRGIVDESTAIKAGKIAAADGMLLGSVLERENSIEIYARLLDTETAEVLTAIDAYGENMDIGALRDLCRGLDLKLTDALPLVEGVVVKVEGSRIIVDVGQKNRIKNGMKIIVYQIGEPVVHPVSGKVIGLDVKELGQARIKSVMQEMSFAGLEENVNRKEIRPEQYIITR